MKEMQRADVIVVGAGPAGLAAAAALAQSGCKVALLERRPYVGGRAYSYEHPAIREVVDSQHVLLGCCTNLVELLDQAGASDKIRWYDEQTFLEPSTDHRSVRASRIATSGLPAPLHFAPSFAKIEMLGWLDKLRIARGLTEFFRSYPEDDSESVERWLKRTGQTERSIRHFWRPILMATLNDSAANCSTKYAGKVFHELFVKSSTGGRLGIPTVPLSDLYAAAARLVEVGGGRLHLRASVESISREPDESWRASTPYGDFIAESIVLALPFEQTQKLLSSGNVEGVPDEYASLQSHIARFEHAPFTSILLWFDREITDLDHAWLLDTTIEWFFHKSRIRRLDPSKGSYVEVVVAGSRAQLKMGREEILAFAVEELARFFPSVKTAKLLKSCVLKEARATFSVTPGLDRFRPQQKTEWPGLYFAGDWTATDWPSTMEGAVRSGRLAAGAIVGDVRRFMAEELPASGFMPLLIR